MPNESSYAYTATPVAYGPSGELVPSFEPYLGRYRDPAEVTPVVFGQMDPVEEAKGAISMDALIKAAPFLAAGFALCYLMKGK